MKKQKLKKIGVIGVLIVLLVGMVFFGFFIITDLWDAHLLTNFKWYGYLIRFSALIIISIAFGYQLSELTEDEN